MRFLVDANLPRRTSAVMRGMDLDALDVREIGLGAASDDEIAKHAKSERMILISRDYDFADTRHYPPDEYAGIVVLSLPKETSAETVLRRLSDILSQVDLLAKLSGRLAIVEPSRIRFRPT